MALSILNSKSLALFWRGLRWLRLKVRLGLLSHHDFLLGAFILILLATIAFGFGCVLAALQFAKV